MQQTTPSLAPMTFFFGAENPLSNWHPARFTVNGVDFKNNEQFMMYCKAKLFGDEECAERILQAETPREHKALGRSVRGFDQTKWEQKCEHYVFVGSLAKFRQNRDLGDYLVKTGNTELVEASPYDRIWGVGLSANDPRIHNRSAWLGENRLGTVQMQVREALLRERGNEAVPDDGHPTHIDGVAPPPGAVFVFGSNLAGRHGAGAAKYAAQHCQAEYGVGIGRTGNSYAIPTKGNQLEVLPLSDIYGHVKQFITYAKQNPTQQFHLTRVGCGLAGYRDTQVAPLFIGVPKNVNVPDEWAKHVEIKRNAVSKGIER